MSEENYSVMGEENYSDKEWLMVQNHAKRVAILEEENERLKDAIRAGCHEEYSHSPQEAEDIINDIISGD